MSCKLAKKIFKGRKIKITTLCGSLGVHGEGGNILGIWMMVLFLSILWASPDPGTQLSSMF